MTVFTRPNIVIEIRNFYNEKRRSCFVHHCLQVPNSVEVEGEVEAEVKRYYLQHSNSLEQGPEIWQGIGFLFYVVCFFCFV